MAWDGCFRKLCKLARAQGWYVRRQANGHFCWTSPGGQKVTVSGTPSDHRALLKVRADFKRAGLVLDDPRPLRAQRRDTGDADGTGVTSDTDLCNESPVAGAGTSREQDSTGTASAGDGAAAVAPEAPCPEPGAACYDGVPFNAALQQVLATHNLTATDLDELIGAEKGTTAGWENGSGPSAAHLDGVIGLLPELRGTSLPVPSESASAPAPPTPLTADTPAVDYSGVPFSEALRAERCRNDDTIAALALRLHTSPQNLYTWEAGTCPRASFLEALYDCFPLLRTAEHPVRGYRTRRGLKHRDALVVAGAGEQTGGGPTPAAGEGVKAADPDAGGARSDVGDGLSQSALFAFLRRSEARELVVSLVRQIANNDVSIEDALTLLG